MGYKPEIDGLRALAVLAIVFFHFNVKALSGGFVGVDVFFVISGYLITSIVAGEIDRGEFTFKGFYARRARRILPASLALLAAMAVFGWFALLPTDLVVLGGCITATVCFVSNFFLLGQVDYFGADSHTLHLLHMWSLAVEEQFYLFFPLLLFALRKTRKDRAFWIVLAVSVGSLLISAYWMRQTPERAFYLLPSRAWELLVGALIALRTPQLANSPRLSSVLTLAGLALIGVAVGAYDTDTPFPGLAALIPTLGAALIIVASSSAARILRWPLTNRVMVWIGKISYSMYLWHWPMMVIYRLTFKGNPAFAPLLFVPLLPLSYASYRFIEHPFRKPSFWKPKPKLALALAASATLAAYGLVATKTHGMVFGLDARTALIADAPNRRQPSTFGGNCFKTTPWKQFAIAECLQGTPGHRSILLWGDSVAAHYSFGLRTAARGTDIDILQATMPGCPPSLGLTWKSRPLCKPRNEALLEYVKEHPPSLVVLSGLWPWNRYPNSYKEPLARLLAELRNQGLRVVVLGPPLQYSRPLPELLVKYIKSKKTLKTTDFINKLTKTVDHELKNGVVNLSGATLVSLFDLLCSGWECPTLTPEGMPLQWDTHHLTQEGSLMIGKKLFPILEAELDRKEELN